MINNNNGKIIKFTKMRKPLLLVLSSVFAVSNLFAGNSDWTDRPHTGKPLVHWSFSKDRVNWEDVSVPHSYWQKVTVPAGSIDVADTITDASELNGLVMAGSYIRPFTVEFMLTYNF